MNNYRTNLVDDYDTIERVEIHPNTNSNILTITSNSRTSGTNSRSIYESNLLLKGNVNKMGISKYFLNYNIPTINSRNNIITITNNINTENIILTDGFYSLSNLMSMVETRLNTNSLGIVFTITSITDSKFYLLTTNIPFRFLSSSHLDKARSNTGLFLTDDLITSMTIYPKGLYSSYIDFITPQLRDGANSSNVFTENVKFNNGNHFLRVYYYNYDKEIELENIIFYDSKKRKISVIEIDLIDEYGEIVIDSNIDYIEYNLELITSL